MKPEEILQMLESIDASPVYEGGIKFIHTDTIHIDELYQPYTGPYYDGVTGRELIKHSLDELRAMHSKVIIIKDVEPQKTEA